jgi:hypothetical protein
MRLIRFTVERGVYNNMANRTTVDPYRNYSAMGGAPKSKPYIPFNWHKIGEPLTPLLILDWRQGYRTSFPNRMNRIYVQQANFNVLDENGFSSASITLADPDFINLEYLFTKALFFANSGGRDGNLWYLSAMWGWSMYGTPLKNPSDEEKDGAQYKLSGKHFYMLSNLTYTIDTVELIVTIDLIDIGESVFGSGDEMAAKTTVGVIKGADKYGAAIDSGDGFSGNGGYLVNMQEELAGTKAAEAAEGEENIALKDPIASIETSTAEGAQDRISELENSTEENIVRTNVFKDKTRWDIIKAILGSQNPAIKVEKVIGDGEPDIEDHDEKVDEKKIPESAGLRETIENLLNEIPAYPKKEDREDGEVQETTKHWEIMPGGSTKPGSSEQRMLFGWAPDPPTRGQSLKVDKSYRLARIFTYRPGVRNEIASGETMINELNYEWTSRGYWNFGMPTIFGVAEDREGNPIIIESKDDWSIKRDKVSRFLVGSPPSIDSKNSTKEAVGSRGSKEASKKIALDEAVRKSGLELNFNFGTNLDTEEKITTQGKTVILNVWNQLYKELIDVTIRIPGDPFLDNRILSRTSSESGDILSDLLVDLYNAYFIIKVYTEAKDGSRQPSKLFEGKYLCLNGCSHRIEEGEYSTELRLFKAF